MPSLTEISIQRKQLSVDLREALKHNGLTLWFTGMSAAGKSTLSRGVATQLQSSGVRTELLDADEIRKHLNRDLGFSKEDRDENVRRIAYVAGLLTKHDVVVLVCAVSPFREARHQARQHIGRFIEVFVDAPLHVCEERDPNGLYRRFRAGQINHVAGVDDPYEKPEDPEVHCHTDRETVAQCAANVVDLAMRYILR